MSYDVSLKIDARPEEYDKNGGVVGEGGAVGFSGWRVWFGFTGKGFWCGVECGLEAMDTAAKTG